MGGGFGGLTPPNKAFNPPKLNPKALQINDFWQFLECQGAPHKRKDPHRNAKPPYWKLSGDGSQD